MPKPSQAPSAASSRWPAFALPLALATLLGLCQCLVLGLHLPVFTSLRGWFWKAIDKPFAFPAALIGGVVLLVAALFAVLRAEGRWALRLSALIVLGFALQHGLALLEGRGLDGMRDRIIKTGHAEFALVAVQQESLWRVLRQYEPLVDRGALGRYAHSKPPGQLLFYMLTERAAQALHPQPTTEARLEQLRTVAAVVWPLVSCLALLPLFLFTRRAFDERRAFVACTLYLLVPSFELITLHTDQVLFPLLTMSAAWLTLVAYERRSLPVGAGAGALFYLAMFFSFPLGAAAPIACATGVGWLRARREEAGPERTLSETAAVTAAILGGVLALWLVLRFGLDYDFFTRYRGAIAFHEAWKRWTPGLGPTVYFGSINLLEFAFWLGFPLALLAVAQSARSLQGLRGGWLDADAGLAVGLAAVLLAFALLGKTKGEVARLWLFLVPFVCVSAAGEADSWRQHRYGGHALALLLTLQGLALLFVKRFQDFW